MVTTLEQLANLVRGRLVGDGTVAIRSARPVAEAGPGDITFVDDDRYNRMLRGSPAAAAIVGPHFRVEPGERELPRIEVDDPRSAFIAVRTHLAQPKPQRWRGIHDRAYVASTARIGRNVAIHPLAYVGEDAEIGDGCTLYPGAVVGDSCVLGRDVILHPNVVLYDRVVVGDRVEIHSGTVIGADGYGYRIDEGRHVKVPQTGIVEIASDVEIGANCAIDRGTFEATVIGEGTKIDNLVMIGHNNRIGRHNLLCGQVGIAGSCTTGDYVVMGGQVGLKDHVSIGDGVMIGAQSGVHQSIPSGQQVLGAPAMPVREQRRLFALLARLPEMHRQVRELAAQVARMMGTETSATDDLDDAPREA